MLACLAAQCGLAAASEEDTKRQIRLKTTRQLKEILSELKIDFPANAGKDELRDVAFANDALKKYEMLPGKQRTPKPTGGAGGGSGSDMTNMMFQAMDKNKDGLLTKAEMAMVV